MFDLTKIFNECKHEKVSYFVKASYCPDCGQYIENKYYIVRCACCGIKRLGVLKGDKIVPEYAFCHNCGEEKYRIEELTAPNFFDLDYMIIKKEVKHITPCRIRPTTQVWVETPVKKTKLMLTIKQ